MTGQRMDYLDPNWIASQEYGSGCWLVGFVFGTKESGEKTMREITNLYNAAVEATDPLSAHGHMLEIAMPGPVSDSYRGPSEDSPYVPSWCYPRGPKMCPCGHHEGYHADDGACLLARKCGCKGLPAECSTDPIDS